MKKFLTLRNIVLCGAVLFALVAFFVSFGANLTVTMDGGRGKLLNIVWGCKVAVFNGEREVLPYDIGPSVLPLVGLILVLVGGLGAAVVGLFIQKPWARFVVVGCAVIVLTGAIFQFFFVSAFARAFVDALVKTSGVNPSPEEYNEILNVYKTQFQNGNPSCPGAVLSAIFGIVAAGAAGASQFLPEKQLVK